jgi:hypothetical protein
VQQIERSEGDYRILARAVRGPSGRGYVAAVTVKRVQGIANAPRDAYRDDSLAGGSVDRYVFPFAGYLNGAIYA